MPQGATQSIPLCQMNAKILFQEQDVPLLDKGTLSSELFEMALASSSHPVPSE